MPCFRSDKDWFKRDHLTSEELDELLAEELRTNNKQELKDNENETTNATIG